MVVFCGLPGPQDKDDSAEDLDLGYYFLTRGELVRMRITSTGIIKGCVQRDQWLLASCFNRYFLSIVANKKLAL